MNISGTFYAADAPLNINGKGGVNVIGSQYISRNLNVTGNGDIKIIWNATATARARLIGMVE
jgi:hypothetical protein